MEHFLALVSKLKLGILGLSLLGVVLLSSSIFASKVYSNSAVDFVGSLEVRGQPMSNSELDEETISKLMEALPKFIEEHPEVVESDKAVLLNHIDSDSANNVVEEHVLESGDVFSVGHSHLNFEEAQKLGVDGIEMLLKSLEE